MSASSAKHHAQNTSANPSSKVLRACVIQGGKITDEVRLRRGQPLTIGQSTKNTFVIPDASMPATYALFECRAGVYTLVLTESMRGKISGDAGSAPTDFTGLKAQGLLKKQGDFYRLPLQEHHRGKVVLDDTTIIFQFVVPPPPAEKFRLPEAARGTLWQSIDWPYAWALLLAFLLEGPLIAYMHVIPAPEAITIDTIDNRWAELIVPERKPEDKKKPEKVADENQQVDPNKKAEKQATPQEEEPAADEEPAQAKARAERREQVRENIQSKGILAILGTAGSGSATGAVADVFAEGGIGGDLDSAFEGIAGVGLATDTTTRTKRGGGTGEAASIGGLATAGGGKVGIEGKKEARVGLVKTEAPEVDGSLDSGAVARVVQSRMRMVQDCYNRELKRDPNLAGKIEIEFTIGEDGSITDARVSSNQMGSDAVATCIVGRIRRWRFPKPDGGSVTVNFPFIFTPSS